MKRSTDNERNSGSNSSSRRRTRQFGGVPDYMAVDPGKLLRAIAAVALQGGALRLGYTSDGGAYAIGIYGDGEPYTDYVKPSEDLDAYFDELRQAWE